MVASVNRNVAWFGFAAILALAIVVVGGLGLFVVSQAYGHRYTDRVYAGVSVYGLDLSGLPQDEAAATLQAMLPDPSTLTATLRTDDHTWKCTWAQLGISLDARATAALAYRVGREGSAQQRYREQLQALLTGHPLPPVVVLPEPTHAAAALQELAPELLVPPVDAALQIGPDGIKPVPAQAGRAVDVDATVTALPHAVRVTDEGLEVDLLTKQVEPAIANTSPAQAQAEALLAQAFSLTGDDLLTEFSATWSVEPRVLADWLVAEPAEDADGPHLALTVREQAVRAYLEELNAQMSGEIAIDVDETVPAIRAALEAGESRATAALVHPQTTYVVQPGDTLMSIAHGNGFPVWWLLQVNPGINPEDLHPGQEITLPSIDVLFPLPLITERRIVIDMSDLRLYAYQGETLVYNFPCSTGIPSSPTIAGTFQVLSKEENAYASSWDLWMPHFIGIYRSGPDFTNGIHGLPTLSNGSILWAGYLGRQPVSYGCIVIGLEEAATLYDWVELGTLVVIQE